MTFKSFFLFGAFLISTVISPFANAVETIQPSIQIIFDDDELLKEGRRAVHSGQLEKAAFYYEEALKRRSLSRVEKTVVYSDLCVAYMYLERFGEAIEQCKKSLVLQPNRWETLNNLGTVYLVQGDYKSALEVYEQGLKMKPNSRILKFNYDLAKTRAEFAGTQEIELLGPQINNGKIDNDGRHHRSDTN